MCLFPFLQYFTEQKKDTYPREKITNPKNIPLLILCKK